MTAPRRVIRHVPAIAFVVISAALALAFPVSCLASDGTAPCPQRPSGGKPPVAAMFFGAAVLAFVAYRLYYRVKIGKIKAKFNNMVDTLEPGDGILTFGGVLATFERSEGKCVTVLLSPGVRVNIIRESIDSVYKIVSGKPEDDLIPGIREYFPKA